MTRLELGGVVLELTPEQVAEAREQLGVEAPAPGPLDVKGAAATLGVHVEWIREHAAELGGWKVSPEKPKSPWRFDRAQLEQRRQASDRGEAERPKPQRQRRRQRSRDAVLVFPGERP